VAIDNAQNNCSVMDRPLSQTFRESLENLFCAEAVMEDLSELSKTVSWEEAAFLAIICLNSRHCRLWHS
jgi:hypothetical protein